MSKKLPAFQVFGLAILSVAVLSISVQAAPLTMSDQTAGLLGSPVAQVPAQDPIVQQAINWIQSRSKQHDIKINSGETLSRRHRHHDLNQVKILGGPEIVPM
jgi:hypothetical protein